MQIRYFDGSGTEHSPALRRLIALNRHLPTWIYEPVMWRLARAFLKQHQLVRSDGSEGYARWGREVELVGDGTLVMNASFSLNTRVRIEALAPSTINLQDAVRLDVGAMLIAYQGKIEIGARVYIGPYSFVQSEGLLQIGEDTMIGPHVKILAYSRVTEYATVPYLEQAVFSKNMTIGKNVWIGAGATILDGVTIEDNAIIAAGAVVTDKVGEGEVVAGVPARVVRRVVERDAVANVISHADAELEVQAHPT